MRLLDPTRGGYNQVAELLSGLGTDRMDQPQPDRPLKNITTLWTVVCRAHDGLPEEAAAAQRDLLDRYGLAVYRYLLGALRDPHAAEELAQEFALRFLRGDLRRADPERGRFRDFVKGVLAHLIADFYRRQKVQPRPLPPNTLDAIAPEPAAATRELEFNESWREELLNRAWKALAHSQRQTGQLFYAVLRFRAEHPDLRSAQMAEQLGAQLGKPVTAAWVRQTMHRARDKFADLLIHEVVQTLDAPTVEQLQEELLDLKLLVYCQPALKRIRLDSK
jgi:RNA polymerase sigma-70 factor (ECF subfamily)